MNEKNSLLFIPDISGFTAFVKKTEINHSRHIISELLELIIDEDELGLSIAEIEGDAILFYKFKEIPSPEAIIRQAKKTFLAFHTHLKQYEKNRICPCGACSTAHTLTLKFIAHAANFDFIKVKEFKKPYGTDVILAHRLLKNNLEEHDYLLLTDTLFNQKQDNLVIEGLALSASKINYKEIGDVDFHLISLKPLHQKVKAPAESNREFKKVKDPLRLELFIHADINSVFELLTNFEYRLKWNEGVKKINFDAERVNRPGAHHTCIVNGSNINFETVTDDFGKDKLVYGERIKKVPFAKEITAFNILEEKDGGTNLSVEAHFIPLAPPFRFISNFFKKKFIKSYSQNLEIFKSLCENPDQS